jgi:ABC-type phosphate transport system substrate-binding protein
VRRVVLGFVLAAGLGVRIGHAAPPFKVIVNPSVTGRAITRDVLAQIYLGGASRWGNGDLIAAVDLSSTSPIRRAFSEQVLGMSVDGVRFHWLRRIAAGLRPPLSKPADAEVIAFVARQPGGVGYVSAATPLPLTVTEVIFN